MAGITQEQARLEPDKYEICKNGVIRDRKSGRFVAAAQSVTMMSPADAQAMNANRWQMARAAATAGLTAVNGSDYKAIAHIFEKQAGLAADTSCGRASTHAAEFIMTKGGYTPDRSGGAPGIVNNTLNVIAGSGLADLLQDIRDKDVIDME